jgi:hypothetical protein
MMVALNTRGLSYASNCLPNEDLLYSGQSEVSSTSGGQCVLGASTAASCESSDALCARL